MAGCTRKVAVDEVGRRMVNLRLSGRALDNPIMSYKCETMQMLVTKTNKPETFMLIRKGGLLE